MCLAQHFDLISLQDPRGLSPPHPCYTAPRGSVSHQGTWARESSQVGTESQTVSYFLGQQPGHSDVVWGLCSYKDLVSGDSCFLGQKCRRNYSGACLHVLVRKRLKVMLQGCLNAQPCVFNNWSMNETLVCSPGHPTFPARGIFPLLSFVLLSGL